MNAPFQQQFLDGSVPFVYDGRDKMVLPRQYNPGDDVVIIGRGKKVREHPANQRFRSLIESQLVAYSNAATKGLKSNILWRVLHEVRGYSASRLGFVKRDSDTGRWYAIDDTSAKINISRAFRDGLHSDYKSSKKRKQLKRQAEIDAESAASAASTATTQAMAEAEETRLEDSIFSALNRFESKLESPPSNKRRCVATNESAHAALDPSDHTLGRLGSTMDRLRDFLASTPNVSLEAPPLLQSNQLNITDLKLSNKQQRSDSWDTFTDLYKKFGSDPKFSEDPFEPKPIATKSLEAYATGSEMVFPNFAMSLMVDETNPLPQETAKKTSSTPEAQFDAAACLKEAILPSILSLSSLEGLSDAGTLTGITSLSSLSTISDCQNLSEAFERVDSCRSIAARAGAVLLSSI